MTSNDGTTSARTVPTGTRLDAAVESSRILGPVRRLEQAVESAAAHSRMGAALGRGAEPLGRWLRGSWVYGWLAAEPDPDVIVIDLGETYTAGPVLAALDDAVGWAGPRWRDSSPRRLLERATAAVADAPLRFAGWLAVVVLVVGLGVAVAGGAAPPGTLLVALGLALLATRERRSVAELRETWAGRALAALLVPPELSENEASDRDERGRE